MDLKEALKDIAAKVEEPTSDAPLEVEEPTGDTLLTFEDFKRKVGSLVLDDKILIQMKLKWYEDATQMIVFQGVRSNVIARLRSNGQHVINRSVFKKRIQAILELDMEPNADQKEAAARKSIHGKGEQPKEEPTTEIKID